MKLMMMKLCSNIDLCHISFKEFLKVLVIMIRKLRSQASVS